MPAERITPMNQPSTRPAKKVADSRTEQNYIIMPAHINGYNRLFGGQLVEWIDIVAGIVARRHCESNITTVAIDNLRFKAPAHVNDLIVLMGQVTYVGRTSMEVRVQTYVEDLSGMRKLINRAYIVMVAIDENERPIEVPQIIPETPEEKFEYECGAKRDALRRQRRTEAY